MKIDKDIRWNLLHGGVNGDKAACGPLVIGKSISDGLITTMYDCAGQEKLDVTSQEQQRIISLIFSNRSQFFNAWRKKRHDMILMLTAGESSCRDVLVDLERIWIHESPLNYQKFCELLRVSAFGDILAIAKQYNDEQYYVNQQNNWRLSPMRKVVAHTLVSIMLRYSFELGILKLPLDDKLQQLLDLLQTDAEADDFDDDKRQSLLLNGMAQEVRNLENTLSTYQSSFFNRKDFVEACIKDKIAIILGVLARGNEEVYRALIAARDHFLSYKGILHMPNAISGDALGHYRAVAHGQGVSWDRLSLPSDRILKTSFDKNNIVQQLYLSFLAYFMTHFFQEGDDVIPGVSLALEKFQQFAQSQDIEFKTIF